MPKEYVIGSVVVYNQIPDQDDTPQSPSPNFVYKSMYPLMSTLLPENPTIFSSMGTIMSSTRPNFLKAFQQRMSTELP